MKAVVLTIVLLAMIAFSQEKGFCAVQSYWGTGQCEEVCKRQCDNGKTVCGQYEQCFGDLWCNRNSERITCSGCKQSHQYIVSQCIECYSGFVLSNGQCYNGEWIAQSFLKLFDKK